MARTKDKLLVWLVALAIGAAYLAVRSRVMGAVALMAAGLGVFAMASGAHIFAPELRTAFRLWTTQVVAARLRVGT